MVLNGPIQVIFEGPFQAFNRGTKIVLWADHEGPLGSSIPEVCTTMRGFDIQFYQWFIKDKYEGPFLGP